jgi:hypothetical protein
MKITLDITETGLDQLIIACDVHLQFLRDHYRYTASVDTLRETKDKGEAIKAALNVFQAARRVQSECDSAFGQF